MEKEGKELLEYIVIEELKDYIDYHKYYRKKHSAKVKYSLKLLEDTLDMLIRTIRVKELVRSMQAFDMTYLKLEIELFEKAEFLKNGIYKMVEEQEKSKIANEKYIKSLKNLNEKLKDQVKSLEDYIQLIKDNSDDKSGDY